MKLVTGNTYPVKDKIKALGGRWDAAAKGWKVPDEKYYEAMQLVKNAPRKREFKPNYNKSRASAGWICPCCEEENSNSQRRCWECGCEPK